MMKKFFIPAILFIQITCVFSQQLPEVSQFMYDYTRTSPGSLGSKDMICATFIHKTALVSFPGNPTDYYLNAEVPFNFLGGKHGAGISIYSDNLGFYENIDIKLGYAFRFSVADGTLGIGINGGIRQNKFNSEAQWVGNGSGINPSTDPYIPVTSSGTGVNSFGFGVGVFYRAEDIYFGASVLNAYATEIDYTKNIASGTSSGGTMAKESLKPHYYLTAGYNLQLSNPAYEIQPAVNLYSDGVSVTFDINGTVTYNKKIWGGVSYRAGAAVVGMVGISIMDGLKVGYAYDFQTSALNRYSMGSHEFVLNYCFKLGGDKDPQRYKSIRYL